MSPQRSDRRAQRTRRQLHAAMLELIDRRSYGKITVDEIARRADVGRSTFYSHFKSKEDLLFTAFGRALRALAAPTVLSQRGRPRRFHFSLPLLRHIGDQRRFALALLANDAGAMIRRKTASILTEVVALELEHGSASHPSKVTLLDPRSAREADARAIAGAYLGLVEWWLTSGTKAPAETVDAIFQQFAASALS